MTVPAVDSESAGVMLMAERNRLLALDPLIGRVRRAHHAADRPQYEGNGEYSAEDRDAGESIGTTVENLSHLQAATYSEGMQRADHIQIDSRRKTTEFRCGRRECTTQTFSTPPRETPPEITSAKTFALSTANASTRSRATTTSVPAMLYENGR